jgi:hypothetical protein
VPREVSSALLHGPGYPLQVLLRPGFPLLSLTQNLLRGKFSRNGREHRDATIKSQSITNGKLHCIGREHRDATIKNPNQLRLGNFIALVASIATQQFIISKPNQLFITPTFMSGFKQLTPVGFSPNYTQHKQENLSHKKIPVNYDRDC